MCFCFFFFFKQKTAYEMRISDWSSDVCSSDLVEGDVAVFQAARDVDLRGRDDVDVVLDDRRGVVLGQGVLEGLLATHKGPEARFEDLAGRLARPEAGQADLLGDLLEGGGDGLVELVRGNLEIGRAHV